MDARELTRIASIAARRYKRRCWWADERDLRQEALVAVLAARATFDPAHGAPFGAYALRAAILALRPYLWRNSSPVSETWHKLPTLRGVLHTPLEAAAEEEAPEQAPGQCIDRERWHAWVQERLRRLDPLEGHGVDVLLAKRAPEHVAADLGLEPHQVKRAVSRLKNRALNDYPLWKLHWNGEP